MNDQEQTPQEPAPKRSNGKRVLIGCAIGCGSLVLLCGLAGIGLFWYIVKPAAAVSEQALLSPKTTAFLRARIDLNDPGLGSLLQKILAEQQKQDLKNFPEGLREIAKGLRGKNSQQQVDAVRALVRAQVVMVCEPSADEKKEEWLVAASIMRLPLVWGFLLKMAHGDLSRRMGAEPHGDEQIAKLEDGQGGMAVVGSHVIFGSTIEMTRRGIDRVKGAGAAPAEAPGTPGIRKAIEAADGDRDVIAVITNEAGSIGRLLKAMNEKDEPIGPEEFISDLLELPIDQIVHLAVDADLETEKKMVVNIRAMLKDPSGAAQITERLNYFLTAIESQDEVLRSGVVIQHSASEEPDGLRVTLEFTGIDDWLIGNMRGAKAN